MIKALSKVGNRGSIPHHNKAIYEKHTANSILHGQKLSVSLKIENKTGCLLSPLLFNIVLKILAIAIRPEEVKGIQTGKKKSKIVIICRWHDTVYTEP